MIRPFVRFAAMGAFGFGLLACSETGEDGTASRALCPESPAPRLFDHAICVCGDLVGVGALATLASNGERADIGVNGVSLLIGGYDVGGSWRSDRGFVGAGWMGIGGDLVTKGDLWSASRVETEGDLVVGGRVAQIGSIRVGGALRVKDGTTQIGLHSYGSIAPYVSPPGSACGCDAATLLDIRGMVAGAAGAGGDIGSHTLGFSTTIGAQEQVLTTGKYFMRGADLIGFDHVIVRGAVSIYVRGDLNWIGSELFDLEPGSTLDVYVDGNVRSVGTLDVGRAGDASAVRLYIGGTDRVLLSVGAESFKGSIYAPTAEVGFVGETFIEGALFAKQLGQVGYLEVDYRAPALPDPVLCRR